MGKKQGFYIKKQIKKRQRKKKNKKTKNEETINKEGLGPSEVALWATSPDP